jgi:hypothetical protein
MESFKRGFIFVMGVIAVVTFVRVVALFIPNTDSKYVIYAADRVYRCNEFQVSGNTIYFKDIHKKNVCINGNYTLIYETEGKQ